jgi:hypothetical protein
MSSEGEINTNNLYQLKYFKPGYTTGKTDKNDTSLYSKPQIDKNITVSQEVLSSNKQIDTYNSDTIQSDKNTGSSDVQNQKTLSEKK